MSRPVIMKYLTRTKISASSVDPSDNLIVYYNIHRVPLRSDSFRIRKLRRRDERFFAIKIKVNNLHAGVCAYSEIC